MNFIENQFPRKGDYMKPYDLNELLKKLKDQGLELTEEAAKIVIVQLCAWLEESADASPNKIDDVAKLGIPELKKLALGLADKINPADNAAPSA